MDFAKKTLLILVTSAIVLSSVCSLSFLQPAIAQKGESSGWTLGSPTPRPTTEVAAAVLGDTAYKVCLTNSIRYSH